MHLYISVRQIARRHLAGESRWGAESAMREEEMQLRGWVTNSSRVFRQDRRMDRRARAPALMWSSHAIIVASTLSSYFPVLLRRVPLRVAQYRMRVHVPLGCNACAVVEHSQTARRDGCISRQSAIVF